MQGAYPGATQGVVRPVLSFPLSERLFDAENQYHSVMACGES
jgi:hypothetical protein